MWGAPDRLSIVLGWDSGEGFASDASLLSRRLFCTRCLALPRVLLVGGDTLLKGAMVFSSTAERHQCGFLRQQPCLKPHL